MKEKQLLKRDLRKVNEWLGEKGFKNIKIICVPDHEYIRIFKIIDKRTKQTIVQCADLDAICYLAFRGWCRGVN